jgi:hypothetical protein
MEKLEADIASGTFRLTETHRFLPYKRWITIIGNVNQYLKICGKYDPAKFEERAEYMDYIFISVKPEWEGYIFAFLFKDFISEAVVNQDFENCIDNHILFWEEHLFQQPYIKNIVNSHQYTDLILRALYIHHTTADHDDIERRAVEERYRTYLARSFAKTQRAVLEKARERCQIIKEDLMAAAWHPRRVERWLQEGYSLDEIIA